MREIINFLSWQWRRFEVWQKMFIFSMFLQGVAFPLDKPWSLYISGLGLFIILAWMSKWLIWDGVKNSWESYKKSRNELLTTIKNSDRK